MRSWVICHKFEGVPLDVKVPDLADFVVSEDPPFNHTGLEFAGPCIDV